jgi:glycosyltransferase involved in cell wall biosynthesis
MSDIPLVSALMAVRNGAATISDAVRSVLAWGEALGELVVVDDGSCDATPALLAGLAGRDPRIVLITTPARGLVPALNTGLEACRGRYVARMDADDLACRQRLELQLPLLEADHGLALVDGQVELFRDEGPVPEGMRLHQAWLNAVLSPQDFELAFSVESPVVHPAATFRRRAVVALGGYRASGAGPGISEGPLPEDYDLWLRLQAAGWRFRKVERVLVRMRDRPERLTRTHPAYHREAFRRARMLWLADTDLARIRRVVVWGAGKEGRPWIRWLLATGHQVAAVVDIDPRKIGSVRQGVPVIEPADLASVTADLCLVAVGARGARPLIRGALAEIRPSWREGVEFRFLR